MGGVGKIFNAADVGQGIDNLSRNVGFAVGEIGRCFPKWWAYDLDRKP